MNFCSALVREQVAPRFKMIRYSNSKYLKFTGMRGLTRGLIFARLKMRLFEFSMHPKAPVLQSDLKPPLLPKWPASYPRDTRGSPATKSVMISSLKRAEFYRIWLSGEAAISGRENQGDHWVLTSGLDLQLPIVCAGLRTLSLASGSVQNLGRWDARLMKLARDRAWTGEWVTMCLKRGSASSNWLNWDWEGLAELSTEMIQ